MEQYYMPKKLDFENLRYCLDNYTPTFLFIRLVGSSGGEVKVSEKLINKTLDFRKDNSGLVFLINSNEVFYFPLRDYQKGFSVGYERIKCNEDGLEKMIFLSYGENPDDKNLPEPRSSILRNVLDRHLIEISFEGRIPLKFHSWWEKSHWKYWTIDKQKNF